MVGDPSDQDSADAAAAAATAPTVALTETQHRILAALCAPALGEERYATPATNQEIAAQVFLSVDAVKAHLRTLYRKFGIEDLPHNRKRARLLELALEGGYLDAAAPVPGPAPSPPDRAPSGVGGRGLALTFALLGLAALLAGVLALAGVFSGGESGASTGVAAYRSDVRSYCRLALSGEDGSPGGNTAQRALSYLEVIETLRGRLDSVPPPSGSSTSLERFRDGLARAARFNGALAEAPPPSGSREQSQIVAELTIAAGQVQAGAIGYELGAGCEAVGDLVARSAQNAAAP